MSSGKYILNGHEPVLETNLVKWMEWFEKADRLVAYDEIHHLAVSTCFLGLDHSYTAGSRPMLFETLTFLGAWRYATWAEAEAGHAKVVATLAERAPKRGDVVNCEGYLGVVIGTHPALTVFQCNGLTVEPELVEPVLLPGSHAYGSFLEILK